MTNLSARLREIVDHLPLKRGMIVLEIGCGPGAMAREMAKRIAPGKVIGIDRSAKAIAQAIAGSEREIEAGWLDFRQSDIESFARAKNEPLFDLAVAIRVGALDGRHPQAGVAARAALGKALKPGASLYVDGGDPIKTVDFG